MKVLIVGGSSVLAKALSRKIISGMEVVLAGRSGEEIYIDLQSESVTIPSEIDTVVHLSAQFGGKELEDNIQTELVNALGPLKIYNASLKAGVSHFIYVSSIYAKMDSSSAFFSTYSMSKRHAEELLKHAQKSHFMPLTILRPVQFYEETGAGRKHQPFVYAMADKAENNIDIVLQGNKDPIRNFIHLADLVTILEQVISKRIEGDFDCGGPGNVTFGQIANAAIRAFDSKSSVSFDLSKPDLADNVVEMDEMLYKKINWYPSITIEEGMRRMAKYRSKAV